MLQVVANSQTSEPPLGPLSVAVAGVSDGRTSYVVAEGTQLGGAPFTGKYGISCRLTQ